MGAFQVDILGEKRHALARRGSPDNAGYAQILIQIKANLSSECFQEAARERASPEETASMTYSILIAILSVPVLALSTLRQIAARHSLPAKISSRKLGKALRSHRRDPSDESE